MYPTKNVRLLIVSTTLITSPISMLLQTHTHARWGAFDSMLFTIGVGLILAGILPDRPFKR